MVATINHSPSHVLRHLSKEERKRFPLAGSEPQTGDFILTPEVAHDWMSRNTENFRTRDGSHAEALAKEIRAGRWMFNPSPIVFATDGTLIDGQHRVSAIAAGDIAVPVHVRTGMPKELMQVLDIGKKRTVSSILQYRGMKYASICASVALMTWHRANGESATRNNNAVATLAEQIKGLERATAFAARLERDQTGPRFRASCLAFFLVHGKGKFQDRCDFAEAAVLYQGVAKNSPADRLHRRQVALMSSRGKNELRERQVNEVAALLIAYAAHRSGSRLALINFPESFSFSNLPGLDQ